MNREGSWKQGEREAVGNDRSLALISELDGESVGGLEQRWDMTCSQL